MTTPQRAAHSREINGKKSLRKAFTFNAASAHQIVSWSIQKDQCRRDGYVVSVAIYLERICVVCTNKHFQQSVPKFSIRSTSRWPFWLHNSSRPLNLNYLISRGTITWPSNELTLRSNRIHIPRLNLGSTIRIVKTGSRRNIDRILAASVVHATAHP